MWREGASGWAGLPVPCTNLNDALLRSVRLLFQSCGNTKGPWNEREIVWAGLVQHSGMRERGFFPTHRFLGAVTDMPSNQELRFRHIIYERISQSSRLLNSETGKDNGCKKNMCERS